MSDVIKITAEQYYRAKELIKACKKLILDYENQEAAPTRPVFEAGQLLYVKDNMYDPWEIGYFSHWRGHRVCCFRRPGIKKTYNRKTRTRMWYIYSTNSE